MNLFDQIQKLVSRTPMELSEEMNTPDEKDIKLGMTRYEFREGSLSDGHMRILPEHIYYAAQREGYHFRKSIRSQLHTSKKAQADLIEAHERLEKAVTAAQRLRAEAEVGEATDKLHSALKTISETQELLAEADQVISRLKPMIREKYPEGIEQAMPVIWKGVARYQSMLRRMGFSVNLAHIPMEKHEKARLGMQTKDGDLCAWLVAEHWDEIESKYQGNERAFLQEHLNHEDLKLIHSKD